MAGASRLGMNKKIQKPILKGKTKRGFSVKSVMNYLKSDSYLYSQLISPASSSSSVDSIPVDVNLSLSTQDRKMIWSEEYLKSDSYLYAPLLKITHQPSSSPQDTGGRVQLKKMNKTVMYTKISGREVSHKSKEDQRR